MNKRSELDVIISTVDPDIIGITEILPKNRDMIPQDGELKIDGYDHFSNLDRCKRGVIIYTRESLNAVVLPLKEEDTFEESVWCQIQLINQDTLNLGVIYRSPNSPPENHDYLQKLDPRSK